MLAGKPPTTGEKEGRPSGKALGTVEMLAIKPPTTVKKKGKLFQASHCLSGIITTRCSVKTSP